MGWWRLIQNQTRPNSIRPVLEKQLFTYHFLTVVFLKQSQANPLMTIFFLPLFTNVVYPGLERCGIKVTLLRRMSLGQISTAFAFVIAGLTQSWIEADLTPIPNYGDQNSMMVLNGLNNPIIVTSDYWNEADIDRETDYCGKTEWKLDGWINDSSNWRTTTFACIRDDLPSADEIIFSSSDVKNVTYTIGKDLFSIPSYIFDK